MQVINWRRLALTTVAFMVIGLPLYLLVLRSETKLEPGFANAALLDTPPVSGVSKVGLKEGELAPDFEISEVDGARVRLSDLRGRPVLVSFYALWCTSCLAEMPDIKALQEQRGLDSFEVVAINTGESRERALEFIDFIQAPFTWGLDFDLTVSDAYGVFGLPYSVYLDSDGVVRAVYAGLAEKTRLEAYVDAAFTASTPPTFPAKLRTISSIPRDRVLQVQVNSDDSVLFTSRSLRCDPSYCADAATGSLGSLAGISSIGRAANTDGLPTLEVRFDPAQTSASAIVDALAAGLRHLPDPLYSIPLEVTYN